MEQERRESEHAKQRHEFRLARLERIEAERKAKLRKKKEALSDKPAAKKSSADGKPDDKAAKQAAIEAAMQRAAEKKAKQQTAPKNTENLTTAQQAQIDEVDQRRKAGSAEQTNQPEPPA